jgi:cell division protease FtsH
MVTEYGMSAKLGAVKYGTSDAEPFMGRDYGHQRDYSEEIASWIDEEVRGLIEAAHDEAWEILVQYRDVLDQLVLELAERETLNKEDLERILAPVHKRPPHSTFAGFGKRTPSDRPPIEIPATVRAQAGTSNGVNGSANGASPNGVPAPVLNGSHGQPDFTKATPQPASMPGGGSYPPAPDYPPAPSYPSAPSYPPVQGYPPQTGYSQDYPPAPGYPAGDHSQQSGNLPPGSYPHSPGYPPPQEYPPTDGAAYPPADGSAYPPADSSIGGSSIGGSSTGGHADYPAQHGEPSTDRQAADEQTRQLPVVEPEQPDNSHWPFGRGDERS